jgi:hypothetical protein
MQQHPSSADDAALWRTLRDAFAAEAAARLQFERAKSEFLAGSDRAVRALREQLTGPDWRMALGIAARMPTQVLSELLPELVRLASWGHGAVGAVREMILSLPRGAVRDQIEGLAEPLLETGTYDEYRRFLELYRLLDRRLMLKLARRAAAHTDPDIREAGEEFLAGSRQEEGSDAGTATVPGVIPRQDASDPP